MFPPALLAEGQQRWEAFIWEKAAGERRAHRPNLGLPWLWAQQPFTVPGGFGQPQLFPNYDPA